MPTAAISGQTTFGANTSGTTTQLDNNFLLAYNALNNFNQYTNYLADSGAANAYVVTAPAGTTVTLAAGLAIQFKASAANTAASTINVNGTGVKNILNMDGTALGAGQIPVNSIVSIMYDGTQYQLLNSPVGRGTFTITLTGFTANPTGTAVYSITNNVVTLYIPPLTATSNATTMAGTGLPAAIIPTTNHLGMFVGAGQDNGGNLIAPVRCDVLAAGSINFYANASSGTNWTNVNTKGLSGGGTITYNLN